MRVGLRLRLWLGLRLRVRVGAAVPARRVEHALPQRRDVRAPLVQRGHLGGRGKRYVRRGGCPYAVAGTRTQYVQYVRPWGHAALRSLYVPYGGPGAYASAQAATVANCSECAAACSFE